MPIHGQCPGCGREFQAPDRLSGKRVKCPNCSAAIELGSPEQRRTAEGAAAGQEASQTPAPPRPPDAEGIQWYVKTADGQQLGPMGKARLDALVAEGRLDGFCQLRRGDWQGWKWAEAVYPQFALPVEPEAEAKRRGPPTGTAAQTAAAGRESRLRPCPDCGKMVSKRASDCPSCGCPLGDVAEEAAPADAASPETDGVASAGVSSQKSFRLNPALLVLAGAAAAVVLVSLIAVIIVWQWWGKTKSVLNSDVGSLAEELAIPSEAVPQPPKGKPTTPEEMEQWTKEAAAEMAKRVDDLYRKVHLAQSILNRAQDSADLIQSLLDGDLSPRPKGKPAGRPATVDEPYQSQYDTLYKECLAYIRQNTSKDELDRDRVWGVARSWADNKQAALEEQLGGRVEELLRKPTAPPPGERPKL